MRAENPMSSTAAAGDRASPARRPRVAAATRRDQFLDIAAELLLADGSESVTLQRVARLAEANHATIYRFFENRDDLLIALAERSSRQTDAVALDALMGVDLEHQLRELITRFLSADVQRSISILDALASTPARSTALRDWQGRHRAETIAFLADVFRAASPGLSAPNSVILASTMGAAVIGIVALAEAGTPVPLLVDSFTRICLAAAAELAGPDELG